LAKGSDAVTDVTDFSIQPSNIFGASNSRSVTCVTCVTDEDRLRQYLDKLLAVAQSRPYGCVQGRIAIVNRDDRQ